jgi:UDPglucose 6-dehydrogenase
MHSLPNAFPRVRENTISRQNLRLYESFSDTTHPVVNAISALCEASGADVREVSKVLGSDRRIGSKFLNASIGFGGSCFAKDLLGLIYLCEHFFLPVVADYWRQVLRMNDFQKERFCKTVLEKMFGTVKGKKIAILGFAFKKDTSDFRESAAISVSKTLLAEGAQVCVYDPAVNPKEVAATVSSDICFVRDAASATDKAHAVVILTEWEQFLELDWPQIYNNMNKPAYIFDGRNLLNDKMLASIGFQVHSIGKPYHGHDYRRV